MSTVPEAIDALRRGLPVVMPTDTVYGLAADGASEEAARRLYAAKGRDAIRPTAVLFASVDEVLARVPELPVEARAVARALLPGPVTLVLPNPGRRFAWLNGERPETVGVRVPALDGPAREILDALGVLVATSANLPGGPDPRRLEDVPSTIRAAVAAALDGGELPGVASTVVDLTAAQPLVVREGALETAEVLGRARAALTTS